MIVPKPWMLRHPVQTVSLTFDRPPGVNALYANKPGIGRIKTSAYRDWLQVALLQISTQRPGCVRGPFHWALSAERSTRAQDLDGIIKATLDALQKAGVIQNDNLAQSSEQAWTARGTSVRVRVTATTETWHEQETSIDGRRVQSAAAKAG